MPSASSPGFAESRESAGFQVLGTMLGCKQPFSNGFKQKDWSNRSISDKPPIESPHKPTLSAALFWRGLRRSRGPRGRRGRRWGFVLGLDGEQLYLKNQGRPRADARSRIRAAVAITQIGWNKQLPFRSHGHELESFCPAFDDPSHRE